MIGRTGTNKPLTLQGFIDVAPNPNFLIPVFGDEGEEGLYMQAINDRGDVVEFSRLPKKTSSQITPVADLTLASAPGNCSTVGIGDSALFSFRIGDREVWTGTRSTLSERLRGWIAISVVNPLVRLEILEFCNASTDELRIGVTAASRYLDERGVPQSATWAKMQLARLPGAFSDRTRENKGMRFLQSIEIELPEPPLPSVYATTAYEFRDLIESNSIVPRRDEVFGEEIAWFFYGRPAYRLTPDRAVAPNMYPVVIILRPIISDDCHRIFPFDTGAFASGRYSSIHPNMTLKAFECPPNAAGKIVSAFFGSNENYLRAEPQVNLHPSSPSVSALNFEAEAYKSILSGGHNAPPIKMDYRASVPINHETTEGIVLPQMFLEEDVVQSFVSKHSITAIPYSTTSSTPAEFYHGMIMERLIEYYWQRGYLVPSVDPVDELGWH